MFNIQSAYKLNTNESPSWPSNLLWYTWFSAKWIKDDANNYANYVCVFDQSISDMGVSKNWLVKSADLVADLQAKNSKTDIETNFLNKAEN